MGEWAGVGLGGWGVGGLGGGENEVGEMKPPPQKMRKPAKTPKNPVCLRNLPSRKTLKKELELRMLHRPGC